MVDVNESLTRQVASLARLELTEEEVKTFTSQLGEIVKYVDQLQKIDVSGVEPLTHPLDQPAGLREDEVKPFESGPDGRPKVLQAAPESLDDGFKVPPII
jgi:aspartyl-tRNA(Asn)/glutamyl-tRNA(Gln) amidotransferase subunit C